MADMDPRAWLTIIGIGEDGVDGLCSAGRAALARAELVMGSAPSSAASRATCAVFKWPALPTA